MPSAEDGLRTNTATPPAKAKSGREALTGPISTT